MADKKAKTEGKKKKKTGLFAFNECFLPSRTKPVFIEGGVEGKKVMFACRLRYADIPNFQSTEFQQDDCGEAGTHLLRISQVKGDRRTETSLISDKNSVGNNLTFLV